jgi:hypothetical protein
MNEPRSSRMRSQVRAPALIGEANGATILYDAPHQMTLRIPSAEIVVQTTSETDRC